MSAFLLPSPLMPWALSVYWVAKLEEDAERHAADCPSCSRAHGGEHCFAAWRIRSAISFHRGALLSHEHQLAERGGARPA